MTARLDNDYTDGARAHAYSDLRFLGTYHLAFRDLPALFARHVRGVRALDFGCGAGRSTRFLRDLGYRVTGVDIAAAMIDEAQVHEPHGDYRRLPRGDLSALAGEQFNLVLAAFTFDNVGGPQEKVAIFEQLRGLLAPDGCIVTIVSTPELYRHEWMSFSTVQFAENRVAKDGDLVRTVILDIEDSRPVVDTLCGPQAYAEIHARAGLEETELLLPLGRGGEPFAWVNELWIAPWAIRVLRPLR